MSAKMTSVSGLTSITSDGEGITIAAGDLGVVKLLGHDITFNGPDGTTNTDIWFGNINHIYFGAAVDRSPVIPAPTGPVLGYFARQEGGLANVTMDAWNSSAGGANTLSIRRARGTPISPLAVLSGDRLGTIDFRGHAGTGGQLQGALLRVEAAEDRSRWVHYPDREIGIHRRQSGNPFRFAAFARGRSGGKNSAVKVAERPSEHDAGIRRV
jgi:hypothetical protein